MKAKNDTLFTISFNVVFYYQLHNYHITSLDMSIWHIYYLISESKWYIIGYVLEIYNPIMFPYVKIIGQQV